MNEVFLDTNVILYAAINNNQKALDIILNNRLSFSEITEIELLGYHKLLDFEEELLTDLFSISRSVQMNADIKQKAIFLKKKYNLGTPDAIICASAIDLNLPLSTADKKLHKIEELDIIKFEL